MLNRITTAAAVPLHAAQLAKNLTQTFNFCCLSIALWHVAVS